MEAGFTISKSSGRREETVILSTAAAAKRIIMRRMKGELETSEALES